MTCPSLPTPPGAEDVEKLKAQCEVARLSPLTFCDMVIASQGHKVHAHPLPELYSKLFFACYRERRGLLIQAPPEHAKTSTIIPLLMWLLAKKQGLKIGIVCGSRHLSEEHLTRVRKTMLGQEFRTTFPDVQPDHARSAAADKGEWSKEKLYLKGQSEPAFERYPLFGATEGHRLDMIWADDCVGRDCLYSEAARRNTSSALFETFENRLTDNGMMLYTNNCWHREDAIHKIKGSPINTTLWVGYNDVESIHFEITNPPDSWTEPTIGSMSLWAQWPRERLLRKQQSPGSAWQRLFRGQAVAPEDSRFPPVGSWARYESLDFNDARLFGYLDPSGGKSLKKGDYAALLAILKRKDNTFDVVDCLVDRITPSQQVQACFTMHGRWAREARAGQRGFFQIGLEMLAKDQEWLREPFERRREELRKAGDPHWQMPWRISNPTENKESRIERIGPQLENGWLRFPADLEQRMAQDSQAGRSWRRLVYQMEEWPFSDHDDAPDALAGALDLAGTKPPSSPFSVVSVD